MKLNKHILNPEKISQMFENLWGCIAYLIVVIQILENLVNLNKPTIINGDFNFDYWKEKDNLVGQALRGSGFKQLVTLPTTVRGKCIDHVYINEEMIECVYEDKYKLYYPYYTDHEAVRVIIKIIK